MHNREERLRSTFLEGLGDDLVYALIAFTGTFLTILGSVIYWQRSRNDRYTIHPDSQANVQNARNELGGQGSSTGQPIRTRSAGPRSDGTMLTCPICLSDALLAVETNCGHKFCSECMITYWRTGSWRGPVCCPVCRQTVTILFRYFTQEEQSISSQEKTEAEQEINHYNRRFSGEPLAWLDYLRDLPTILRHLSREFFTVGGLVWMFRMRLVVLFFLAFCYFISPLDIIPEAAFGILGFLDDFFVLLLLAIYVSILYRRAMAART